MEAILDLGFGAVLVVAVIVLLVFMLRVLREYERGIVFMLGRSTR
jgi:regulator of protease activity HflC (stomatin/prohibitin superfamily)